MSQLLGRMIPIIVVKELAQMALCCQLMMNARCFFFCFFLWPDKSLNSQVDHKVAEKVTRSDLSVI